MERSRLIELASHYSNGTEGNTQTLPSLSIYRRNAVSGLEAFIYEPIVCLILQGTKVTSIGDHHVDLRPGDVLLVSQPLPVVSRITEASAQAPYLAAILSLDLELVRSLHREVASAPRTRATPQPLAKGPIDQAWLAPLVRYFELLGDPLDAKVLGPSTLREIHYRLLLSPIGGTLRGLLAADSHASRVAKAIDRVKVDFRSPLSVPDLARIAGMSASSFHQHFKSVTGTTPLQYQKDLRLIEARALLGTSGQSVAEAAYAVGYQSPTHFSRDYREKFGLPPSREERVPLAAPEDAVKSMPEPPTPSETSISGA